MKPSKKNIANFNMQYLLFFFFVKLVIGQQNPTISFITRERYANLGDTVDLHCAVHYASGYPVLWVKLNPDNPSQSLIISTDSSQILPDQRYSIRHDEASSTYTLQITKIQKIDTGLYQCQVLIGSASKLTDDAWIHVRIPPVILDNSTQSVATTVGTTISLECYATGFPEPKISWRRENNDILPTGGSVYRGNILTIFDISKHDRGTYYCVADNDVGKKAMRHVGVDVEFPPVVTVPQTIYKQALGYYMDLHCQVEAYPEPSILWLKNQYQLFDDQQEYFITTFSTTSGFTETKLRVMSVEPNDYGQYTCKAINKLGHDQKHVELLESYSVECPPACGLSGASMICLWNSVSYFGTLLSIFTSHIALKDFSS